jgi:hypothetical protein
MILYTLHILYIYDLPHNLLLFWQTMDPWNICMQTHELLELITKRRKGFSEFIESTDFDLLQKRGK